jgi:hypothetical protein
VIAPSPRIEYALSADPAGEAEWREFRPRPERVALPAMLARLLWNSRWNETLFLVSCAERLADQPTAHSCDEIFARIARGLSGGGPEWLRFRLVFVSRDGEAIDREALFVSEPRRRADIATT